MNELSTLSVTQLKRAIALKEQIATLENELSSLSKPSAATSSAAAAPQKKVMSAAARAKIAAAVRARWAKQKAGVTATAKAPVAKPAVAKAPAAKPAASQAKKTMSEAARAKLAEIARKRWAKVRASGKTKL